jgi:glycosyltransferase involved in cell wall biosynthesis
VSRDELVSIVIPVYNGARYLADAIECALHQTHSPVEVIVVDDGSTDDTTDVIARFAEVRCVSQANRGPAAARNRGVAMSVGGLVTFCDSDDRYRRTKVAAQVAYLREQPGAGCVLVGHETFYEPGVARAHWERDEGGTQPQSAMVRRAVFDDVGGFDPAFRFAEGIEWLARVQATGVIIGVLDEVHVDRRIHGENLSYNRGSMQHHLLLAMQRRISESRSGS